MSQLHAVTVVYTGLGDPQVHARGCGDVARQVSQGAHGENLNVDNAVDLARQVYADQIEEGDSPAKLADAFEFKGCQKL